MIREQSFFLELLNRIDYQNTIIRTAAVNLGGTSGSGGGHGSPPGGFQGQLPQIRVAGDTTEAFTPTTGSAGSLLDNLNSIRAWLEPASWFFTYPTDPPSNSLRVFPGVWYYADETAPLRFAGGTIEASGLSPSTQRIDLLGISNTGELSWIEGDEAPTPTPPTPPAVESGFLPIWNVYRRLGALNNIDWEDLGGDYLYSDARPFLNIGATSSNSTLNGSPLYLRLTTGSFAPAPMYDMNQVYDTTGGYIDLSSGSTNFSTDYGVVKFISSGSYTLKLVVDSLGTMGLFGPGPVVADIYLSVTSGSSGFTTRISNDDITFNAAGKATYIFHAVIDTDIALAPDQRLVLTIYNRVAWSVNLYVEGNDRSALILPSVVSPAPGHMIVNNNVIMPQRGRLSLDGDHVFVSDDAGSDTTVFEIGPFSWKEPCRYATSVNYTLSATPDNVDGNSIAINDRILVRAQSNAAQNGIYYVDAIQIGGTGGHWNRAGDFDISSEVRSGDATIVTSGSLSGAWYLSTPDPIALGSTDLEFTQITGGAGGGHIIQNSGSSLLQRTNLNFTGTGVLATDDSDNDASKIYVPRYELIVEEGVSPPDPVYGDFDDGLGGTYQDFVYGEVG